MTEPNTFDLSQTRECFRIAFEIRKRKLSGDNNTYECLDDGLIRRVERNVHASI